jgi:hypothetical protein
VHEIHIRLDSQPVRGECVDVVEDHDRRLAARYRLYDVGYNDFVNSEDLRT